MGLGAMRTVRELIELFLLPPGDLYYHLTLLFALQILLAVAWGYRFRARRAADARRIGVAALGMLFTRVALVLGSAAAGAGALSPAAVLPPLERFLDLALLLFVVWGFLPVFRDHPRVGVGALALGLLAAGVAYLFFAVAWPGLESTGITYNGYWQAQIWEVAGLGVAALALLAILIWARPGSWLLAAALLVWLGGHLYQLLGAPVSPHLAGAVRLANLIAVPLVTGLAFQDALRVVGGADEISSVPVHGSAPGLWALARQVEEAPDVEAGLGAALPLVSSYVGTDVAIGGLLGNTAPVSTVRVAAVHPGMPGVLEEPFVFSVAHSPALDVAVHSRRPQMVTDLSSDAGLRALVERAGFSQAGPLLVEPLIGTGRVLGFLFTGNPMSGRAISPGQAEAAHAAALVLGVALSGLRGRHTIQERSAQVATTLCRKVEEQEEQVAALQEELEEARQGVQEFARRATTMEEEAERQRRRGDEFAQLLRLQEEEAEQVTVNPAQIAIYEEELKELARTRETLQQELDEWKQRVKGLEQERVILQTERQVSLADEALDDADAIITGTLVADARGNIIIADRGAQTLLRGVEADLVGMPLHAAFPDPFWAQAVGKLLSGELRNGVSASVAFEHNGRLGRARLARLSTGTDGASAYVVTLRSELEEDNRAEVVASLSNELRTPMTSIVGYTDLLLSESVGILGEMQRKFLQRVKANVERMGSLLNDVIEVSSIEAKRIELSPELINLISVIEEAIMGLSSRFRERDLTVRLDLALELPPVRADRDALYQIMLHLLSNACQCSSQGTEVVVSGHVEEAEEEGLLPYVQVSVRDTGKGIAPEDYPRVFQRFYRADRALVAGLGETGVGMAITKTLVEAHGGRIWVESEEGTGSTFSFILPVSGPSQEQTE